MNNYNVAERINLQVNASVTYKTDLAQFEVPEFWQEAGKFGAGSLATLGTGGIKTQNPTVCEALGRGNWTIEGWFNKTANGNDINGLFMFMGAGDSTYKQPITLYIENGILYAAVRFDASTRTTISHQTTIAAGEFTHYALVRNGATITLYLNGVAGTTTINSGALSLYPSNILYCCISLARKVEWSTNTYLDGLHDEFRYRREAVYTGNFTPQQHRLHFRKRFL